MLIHLKLPELQYCAVRTAGGVTSACGSSKLQKKLRVGGLEPRHRLSHGRRILVPDSGLNSCDSPPSSVLLRGVLRARWTVPGQVLVTLLRACSAPITSRKPSRSSCACCEGSGTRIVFRINCAVWNLGHSLHAFCPSSCSDSWSLRSNSSLCSGKNGSAGARYASGA